ncbi:MAG: histidinol-phosphate aminotransferase family protein [Bacteroidetes bacterium]|nr:histidinol-phosphate aminotransferase family protein [Bacteroidota bacterium]
MSATLRRRDWLKQSSLAALGLGFGLPALAKTGLTRRSTDFFNTENSLINLGSNENPYGISPKAKQAIIDTIPFSNRYAFNLPDLMGFRATLAKFYNVAPENVLLTAGSSIVLDLFPRYFYKPGGNVVTANPTFFILPDTAKKIGFSVNAVPVGSDRGIDLQGMLSAINNDTQLAYLVNPNNPTGTLLKPAAVKDFCMEASKKTTVLIDEAYLDFIDAPDNESMIPLAASNPNIFVTRTFSKIHGMAGLRIGYLIGHADSIKKLDTSNFTESWVAVSDLSAAAAMASLKDEEHRLQSKTKNAAAREYTIKSLQALNIKPIPSYTNFILFPLGKTYEGNFAEFMLKKNITLRQMDCLGEKHGRVSIGTMEEMQQFIKVMKETWKG